MPNVRTTVLTLTAAAALAAPVSALAADSTTAPTSNCSKIEARLAPKLSSDQQATLKTACDTRDTSIAAARTDRTDARTATRAAVKAANDTLATALKAAKELPAGEARQTAVAAARTAHRAAVQAARTTMRATVVTDRKAVHIARVTFRKVVRDLVGGKTQA